MDALNIGLEKVIPLGKLMHISVFLAQNKSWEYEERLTHENQLTSLSLQFIIIEDLG